MRPTREEFMKECVEHISTLQEPVNHNWEEMAMYIMREVLVYVHKKYLSDPNSVESPETVSE